MKTCSKCGLDKPEEEYHWRNKAKNKRSPTCKKCMCLAVRDHYQRNTQYYKDKARERNDRVREEMYEFVKQYLSDHPCIDCGEDDIVVLDFDHVDPTNKSANIAQLLQNAGSMAKLKSEIKKCDVRCANCHRRRTARDGGWKKYRDTRPSGGTR